MRLVVSFLCALNLALFAWLVWFSQDQISDVKVAPAEVPAQYKMHLLGEVPPPAGLQSAAVKSAEDTLTSPQPLATDETNGDLNEVLNASAEKHSLPSNIVLPLPIPADLERPADRLTKVCYISEDFLTSDDAQAFARSIPELAGLSREIIVVPGVRVRYWVTVAAGRDFESAQKKVEDLKNYGIEGGWIPPSVGDGYVVSAGLFREKQAAKVLLDELADAGFEPSLQLQDSAVEQFAVEFVLSSDTVKELFERTMTQKLRLASCPGE